ncbi:MAG TPA: hypothetical protein DEO94_02760 [Cyanobacteria bacterium UBA11991]|nr:hypothetical protein [Cyanobacteria bacterium UBA11991]
MLVLLIAVIVLLIFAIITYNRLVSLRNYVKEAFSTMDVYLKKDGIWFRIWQLLFKLTQNMKRESFLKLQR